MGAHVTATSLIYKQSMCLCRQDSLPDMRALWLHRLTSSPVARLMGLVHGMLLPLHDLLNAAAAGEPIGQGLDISKLIS